MNCLHIASLPRTVTDVGWDWYVCLMIGDIPVVIFKPNSSILYREGLVISRNPDCLVSIAYRVDRERLDVPLGLLKQPLEVRLLREN
jgi:hypothetical protein